MNRNLNRSQVSMRASLAAGLLAGGVFGVAAPAYSGAYQLTALTTDDNANLTSLGFPAAANVDPNLVNPWGISFGPTTPFWVSDNATGVSTLYSAGGVPFPAGTPLVVTIAPPNGSPPGFTSAPTGQVFNITQTILSSRTARRRGAQTSSSQPKTGRFRDAAVRSARRNRLLGLIIPLVAQSIRD